MMDKDHSRHCTACNGVGLIRTDDPHSDRVYGGACSSCNGTGVAGDPRLGCIIISAVSIVTTVVPIVVWWLW